MPPSAAKKSENFFRKDRDFAFLAAMLICCYPLVPLRDWFRTFAYDWNNHLWSAAYYGEYFRQHGAFPDVVNTLDIVGQATPLFYGWGLYRVAGLLTLFVSAATAFRILAAAATALQFYFTEKLTRRLCESKLISFTLGAMVVWATYQLTNLYNRSAETEFFAVALLHCALCCWLLFATAPDGKRNKIYLFLFGLWWGLSASMHPITAAFGTLFGIPIVLATLFQKQWRSLLGWSAAAGLFVTVFLAPWLYVVLKFRTNLWLSMTSLNDIKFISDSIDRWSTRFSPIPVDPRPFGESTPHLDAQFTFPIFLFCICLLIYFWLSRRKLRNSTNFPLWRSLATVGFLIFVISTMLSLEPKAWVLAPKIFYSIQMAYRLVTYQNIGLFALAVGLLGLVEKPFPDGLKIATAILLIFAGIITAVKISHTKKTEWWQDVPGITKRSPVSLISSLPYGADYMARDDYSTPLLTHPILGPVKESLHVRIPVSSDEKTFGETRPLNVEAGNLLIYITDIQAFPWNEILVDGKPAKPAIVNSVHSQLGVWLPPGRHTLDYRFSPESEWMVLRALSNWAFAAWSLALLYFFFVEIRRKFYWQHSKKRE